MWHWKAIQTPQSPPNPVTHRLEVREIQPLFSGSVTPALRVFPKDTVQTSTIDVTNKRLGDSDERRSLFASLTGPIYVEGAIPGDTLVVRLNKIRPKASYGFSGSLFDPAAIRPDHYAETLKEGQRQVRWRLDASEGVATPEDTSGSLRGLKVPLRPMLGMIGVAPSGNRAVDPNMLGPWGGNWDYNGVVEGTTVYFPVLHPGALLFLGDGHAAQGDGEIVSSGIETSLDVEMTIDLIRNRPIPSPRLEMGDDLITLGVHSGLEGALQDATTAMTLWLKADYGLSEREIATVLGQTIRYDIASVFARNRVVAAKISRSMLKSLKEGR